jgi:HD-like signal output (HDOD) protein
VLGVVKAMVLSAEAERGLKVAGKAGALVERLSEHSLAVTRCAGRLAMALAPEEYASAVADEAALGAALHEVGLLLLAATHPNELLRMEREGRLRDVRLEREALGLGHPEIGAYLCGLWGLPYAVGETIRWHHEPEGLLGRGVDPATVVALADAICGGATTEAVSDLLAQFGIDAEPGGLVGLGKTQDSDER